MGRQGEGDPFRFAVFPATGHRTRHVDQHDRRAARLVLGRVDDEIFLGDLDRGYILLPDPSRAQEDEPPPEEE